MLRHNVEAHGLLSKVGEMQMDRSQFQNIFHQKFDVPQFWKLCMLYLHARWVIIDYEMEHFELRVETTTWDFSLNNKFVHWLICWNAIGSKTRKKGENL